MKNATTLSALVLYATAACGTAAEVNPSNAIATTYSGIGGNAGGNESNSMTGGSDCEGGNNQGGFAGNGGNDEGGLGGNSGEAGSTGVGGDCGDFLGKFTTYSQGGWHNSAVSLITTILSSSGGEIMIGDKNSDYAAFTTSNAITTFLPAMGTPGALQGQYNNPTTTPAGVLAGQTLALKLNILNSNQACSYNLGDLLVTEGTCKDASVNEVLSLADQALAGIPVSWYYSDLNKCVEKINLNFKEGNVDNQYLRLP